MTTTLVYADRDLLVAMAVPLIGVQTEREVETRGRGGFNWLVQADLARAVSKSVLEDIRELLPEDLAYSVRDAIPDGRRSLEVKQAIDLLRESGESRVIPGTPASLTGSLSMPALLGLEDFDPFKPKPIEIDRFEFHGDSCFVGELQGDGFRLPVYFIDSSLSHVAYCNDNPVELTGVFRWCPPYSPRGATSLSLALRVAAVWLP
jgi:hypothetical protein